MKTGETGLNNLLGNRLLIATALSHPMRFALGLLASVAAVTLVVGALPHSSVFSSLAKTASQIPGAGGTTAAADASLPQVTALHVSHHAGQTILTWREPFPLLTDPEPTVARVVEARRALEQRQIVRYRIYRANAPIGSLDGLRPIGEVKPGTGFNTDFYGLAPPPTSKAFRYVVETGAPPVEPNTGIYAANVATPGRAFYAVTTVVNERENRTLSGDNRLNDAIEEQQGVGEPILQRVETPESFTYVYNNPRLEFYTRWEGSPNSNIQSQPADYLVALPPNRKKPSPVGIHMHCWDANLTTCFGWWVNGQQGAVLISSTLFYRDWWIGHPDTPGLTLQSPKEAWDRTTIRPYTQRRLLSFLDWAAPKYGLDLNRVFAAGSSMGGSGALMLALRYPDRIAWALSWVGVHRPIESPQYMLSYQTFLGDPAWRVKFENGTPAWDYFDDATYLRAHPTAQVGLLIFSNGKNDNDIGWRQAVEYLQALQDTRQPHVFVWGQNGHQERAHMPINGDERELPIDLPLKKTLPAFTRSSLDDNAGNGDPADGAPAGQVNLYVAWDPDSARDEPDEWQMSVWITPQAPVATGTVDITPRRTQRFTLQPGEQVQWTSTGAANRAQSGLASADADGLVTLPQVQIAKRKTVIRIVRMHSQARR